VIELMVALVIREIRVKSIIVKSRLPDGDFVINPYIGCQHGCVYCYARFMKRFTGHHEPWGRFVDVKINAPDLIPVRTDKFKGKLIIIGSVCDPYQPVEKKYQLTRKILERLIPLEPALALMTKSDLVVRDLDLLQQFKDCIVGFSLSTLEDEFRRRIEPLAASVKERIAALKKLHYAGVTTVLFISPIFPEITNWKKIIRKTRGFVNEFWFENLNLYPSVQAGVYQALGSKVLRKKYQQVFSSPSNYWLEEKKRIEKFCRKMKLAYRIYFAVPKHRDKKQSGKRVSVVREKRQFLKSEKTRGLPRSVGVSAPREALFS